MTALDAALSDTRALQALILMAAKWNASPDELRAILA